MDGEFEESSSDIIKTLSQYMVRWNEEKHKNCQSG
jgi:hypothetical protein